MKEPEGTQESWSHLVDSDCGHPWTSKSRSRSRLKGEGGELILANAGLQGCP